MKIFRRIYLFLILIIVQHFILIPHLYAATLRSGESIYIAEEQKNLRDLYLFGNSITLDAPVVNDVTAAGGAVTLNGDITGSILAAGGDLTIRSHIGNTLRAAGGNIAISGTIDRDALLAGGNIRLTDTASISGDLLITGGDIQINSPVSGRVYVNGGNVIINNKVGGDVEGNIGNLALGSKAQIMGNLKYKATEKATLHKGAIVKGEHNFQKLESKPQPKGIASAFTTGSLYKLLLDIALGLLLLTFLPLFTRNVLDKIINAPFAAVGTGFFFLVFWPLLSIFLLFLIFLGIASFLFYGLTLILALFIGKILAGWWVIRWWQKKENNEYILDWKAAVVGPLIFFLLFLIPIIGWFISSVIYLSAIGGVVKYSMEAVRAQKAKIITAHAKKSK